jgi:acetyl esterase/lipase
VRAHASELNLDPDRIAVGGGSSGGYLAAAVATLPGFDASTDDLSTPLNPSLQILFNPYLDSKNLPDELSPLRNVRKGIAPAILFNGKADTSTPISTAYDYQRSMVALGSYCEVVAYEGQKHGFFNYRPNGMAYFHKTVGDMLLFLEKQDYLTK